MSGTAAQDVLSQQDLANINDGLQAVKNGLYQADMAKRAGIDVAQETTELNDLQQKLTQLKQVYFPHG